MRREEEEKTLGGWNQKAKRRRWKPPFFGKGWKAFPGYPDGEGPHEREQLKSSRRESDAPGEEGEEVESPKRKVIRVESEETQYNVREANGTNQEEAEKYVSNRA